MPAILCYIRKFNHRKIRQPSRQPRPDSIAPHQNAERAGRPCESDAFVNVVYPYCQRSSVAVVGRSPLENRFLVETNYGSIPVTVPVSFVVSSALPRSRPPVGRAHVFAFGREN